VSLVDIAARRETQRILVGASPYDMLLSPDGKRAFTNCRSSNEVFAIALPEGKIVAQATVGKRPWLLAWAKGRIVCTNFDSHDATILQASDLQVLATLKVGINPRMPVPSPDGKRVYVLNAGSDDVMVIDVERLQVVGTVKVGKRPHRGCVSRDGKWLIVGNQDDGTVSVVDTQTLQVTATLPVGMGVMAVEAHPPSSP
jgi:YVTN family beta-propeller protein